jgi:RimJ/RimL family protein N-acetyltransferase
MSDAFINQENWMTSLLNYLIAQQKQAELVSHAEQARLASEPRLARSASSTEECRPAPLVASAQSCPRVPSCADGKRATAPRVRELRHMTARATHPSAAAAATLALADGTRLSLRQVGAGDRAGFAALFAGLTPESRYQRFLSPKRELTPRELTFFTHVDRVNHEAIAAVDLRDDSIVAVARYVRDATRADVAELAIEVADAFQRMGIGTALTTLMIQHAHAIGLKSLTATTLWENRAARRLFRHHGFRARRSRGPEIEHELKLEELAPQEAALVPLTDVWFVVHPSAPASNQHTNTSPTRHRRGSRGAELT